MRWAAKHTKNELLNHWNHTKYLFWPQWKETSNQQQKEHWKIHKNRNKTTHSKEGSKKKSRTEKRILGQMKMKTQHTKRMRFSKSSAKRKMHSCKCSWKRKTSKTWLYVGNVTQLNLVKLVRAYTGPWLFFFSFPSYLSKFVKSQ